MSLTPELISELRSLKQLTDEGLLTADEFSAKKAQLLGIPAPAPAPAAPVLLRTPPAGGAAGAAGSAGRGRGAATGVKLELSDCGSSIMITGDTLRAKNQLKEMSAQWDKRLVAWHLYGGSIDEVRERLEARGIACVIRQAEDGADPAKQREAELQAEKDAALARGAAAAAGAHLTVQRHKRAVLVTGDTCKLTDVLRALDGKWIATLGGWCHPGKKSAELIAALRADPTNTVEDRTAQPAAASASAKKGSKRRRSQGGGESEEAEESDAFEE